MKTYERGMLMEKFEPLVDKEKVAEVCGVPISTIDYWRRKKKIPAYGFGRSHRYKISEVTEALKNK